MFIRFQQALKTADDRRVVQTLQVHDDLNLWRNFITSLDSRTTFLRDIRPHSPTWKGETDTPLGDM